MSSMFFYIIIHPIAAFIGWLICGLIKQDYVRIGLRSAVLAIAFSPTLMNTGTTEVPVSAIYALIHNLGVAPRPDVIIVIVWIALFLIGTVLHLSKKDIH